MLSNYWWVGTQAGNKLLQLDTNQIENRYFTFIEVVEGFAATLLDGVVVATRAPAHVGAVHLEHTIIPAINHMARTGYLLQCTYLNLTIRQTIVCSCCHCLLSVCLSICVSVCLYVCPSICESVLNCLSVYTWLSFVCVSSIQFLSVRPSISTHTLILADRFVDIEAAASLDRQPVHALPAAGLQHAQLRLLVHRQKDQRRRCRHVHDVVRGVDRELRE